jgi:hypothetical protein
MNVKDKPSFYPDRGMTQREWYAGHALIGLPHLCAHDTLMDGKSFEDHVAEQAFRIADAMINEAQKDQAYKKAGEDRG